MEFEKKQRGGNVVFFNNPNQRIKKLELLVGEILAGNTSIDMRNIGVSILDRLLKMSTINKSQHNKLYKKYFKILCNDIVYIWIEKSYYQAIVVNKYLFVNLKISLQNSRDQ